MNNTKYSLWNSFEGPRPGQFKVRSGALTKKYKKSKKSKKLKKSTNVKLTYFFMEGCGYCKKFGPVWNKLESEMTDIKLEKINGPQNRQLTQKYNVNGFPTIILFKNNYPIHYSGKRDFASIRKFVNTMKSNKSKKLLYFFMEGCGYCKKFGPVWEKIESDMTDIKLEKINGPQNKKITQKYNIKGFPTLILLKGNEHTHYSGKRDYKSIREFVNKI